MKDLVKFILSIFDFYSTKIINALSKKIKENKINVLLDVGSHKGEYISSLNKNFLIENIYGFDESRYFEILEKKFHIQVLNYLIMVFQKKRKY